MAGSNFSAQQSAESVVNIGHGQAERLSGEHGSSVLKVSFQKKKANISKNRLKKCKG